MCSYKCFNKIDITFYNVFFMKCRIIFKKICSSVTSKLAVTLKIWFLSSQRGTGLSLLELRKSKKNSENCYLNVTAPLLALVSLYKGQSYRGSLRFKQNHPMGQYWSQTMTEQFFNQLMNDHLKPNAQCMHLPQVWLAWLGHRFQIKSDLTKIHL